MGAYPNVLSVWDIITLWCNENPLEVKTISLETQRICNIISNALAQGSIDYYDSDDNPHSIRKIESVGEYDFMKVRYPNFDGDLSVLPSKAHEEYDKHCEFYRERENWYYDYLQNFFDTCHKQNFEKSILKSVFIRNSEILYICEKRDDLDMPKFWFDKADIEKVKNRKETKETREIKIDSKNCTKLFKILHRAKEVFFDVGYMPAKPKMIKEIQKAYLISSNEASAIYLILNPNKKGGFKRPR